MVTRHSIAEVTRSRRPLQSLEPQSDGLRIAEQEICIKDVPLTKQPQLADAILSAWSEISEDHWRHFVGSEPNKNEGSSCSCRNRDTNNVHQLAKRQTPQSSGKPAWPNSWCFFIQLPRGLADISALSPLCLPRNECAVSYQHFKRTMLQTNKQTGRCLPGIWERSC